MTEKPTASKNETVIAIETPEGDQWRVVRNPMHMLTIDGFDRGFHHTRELEDGTWVYAQIR